MRISSIRWGVIWVGIGLFFLAINFEVMDSLVFPRLISLWPILLIAIGVELIFRKTRLYFLALISPLLIAAAFILAASYETGWKWDFDRFFGGWSWNYKGKMIDEVEIPFEAEVDTLDFHIDCAEIEFDILPGSDLMFSARSAYTGKSPFISHSIANRTEFISYDYRDKPGFSVLKLAGTPPHADFIINDRLPIKMNLTTEAGRPDMDFSDIRLCRLDLFLDTKETSLRLGDRMDSLILKIEGKTTKLLIIAPGNMGIEIVGDKKRLDAIIGRGNLAEFAEGFRSPDFEAKPLKTRVIVGARVKTITLRKE